MTPVTVPHVSPAWQQAGQTSQHRPPVPHGCTHGHACCLPALFLLSRTRAAPRHGPKGSNVTRTVLAVPVSLRRPVAAVEMRGGLWAPCPPPGSCGAWTVTGRPQEPWKPALTTAGKQGLWGWATEKQPFPQTVNKTNIQKSCRSEDASKADAATGSIHSPLVSS